MTPEQSELDALRAEAPMGDAIGPNDAQAAAPVDGISREIKLRAIAPIVRTIGDGICKRRRVTPLAGDEVSALAEALLNVMDVFNFETDPRVQAIGVLAFVVIGVADKRVPIVDVTPSKIEPEPAPANAAAS